jgi:hypothetical protein
MCLLIGSFTGVRILDREDYNFYWYKTEEMGIIIHTSYHPTPNFRAVPLLIGDRRSTDVGSNHAPPSGLVVP